MSTAPEPAEETPPTTPPVERRVVVAPPAPLFLPEYASLTDPVPELRAACLAAVAWLGDEVRVIADDQQALRVGETLLGRPSVPGARDVLVMANGSARRSEKAPGHLDDRAAGFDERIGAMLERGDLGGLADVHREVADDLLATGFDGFGMLADEGVRVTDVVVDHAADPFGVMYWVVRWQCAS